MPIKSDSHIFGGMQRDYDIAKHQSQFLYDAKNIRFTPIKGDTLLAITNERGPQEKYTMNGKYLGHYTFNDFIIVFTRFQDEQHTIGQQDYVAPFDCIYKIQPSELTPVTCLYQGNLGFNWDNPIETLGVYENKNLLKVYWVDGKNQPRVIKLTNPAQNYMSIDKVFPDSSGIDTQFDFVPHLALSEQITVERIAGEGMFAPGVIQYAFAYYKLNGQESNIFYTTPLNYITFNNRAGNPEERIANSFKITVTGLDVQFDYIRIFSIHRTSYDAVPTVKRITDLGLDTSTTQLVFVDDGRMGDIIDPTELLYIGGEHIIANTITSKDSTLFLGGLEIKRQEALKDNISITSLFSDALQSENITRESTSNGYYTYTNGLLSSTNGFKNREHYRLGIQFQHKTGKWSLPIRLDDHTVNLVGGPDLIEYDNFAEYKKLIINGQISISDESLAFLNQNEYIKARPVCVFPTINDRLVLTQGVLCPTVYRYQDRINNTPYSQSSWFFRLNPSKSVVAGEGIDSLSDDNEVGAAWVEFRHNHILREDATYGGEIQGSSLVGIDFTTQINPQNASSTAYNLVYAVDQSLLTMHSPDIEFDDDINFMTDIDWKLRLVGISNFTSSFGDFDIQTSTPAIQGVGSNRYAIGFSGDYKSALGLVATKGYRDDGVIMNTNGNNGYDYISATQYKKISSAAYADDLINKLFIIYPWHRSGSLNNDEQRYADAGTRTAVLQNKKLGNLRFSANNTWFRTVDNYDITALNVHDSDQLSILRIQNSNYGDANPSYYGNIDTLLLYNNDSYVSKVAGSGSVISNIPSPGNGSSLKTVQDKNISIRMKYKSSKHLVFGLRGDDNETFTVLPSVNNINTTTNSVQYSQPWMSQEGSESRTINFVGCSHFPVLHWWAYHSNQFTMVSGNTYILAFFQNDYYDDDQQNAYLDIPTQGTLYKVQQDQYDSWILTELSSYKDYYQYYREADNYDIFMYKGESNIEFIYTRSTPLYSDNNSFTVQQDNIDISNLLNYNDVNLKYPYLFLAELCREPNGLTDFGGTTDDAILHNVWIPAGEPVDLPTLDTTENPETYTINLIYDQGDTWYTRYDCLKTYPFTEEDENSIIEVGSFMCESRVNADGRYDKNRGEINNLLNFRPTNFNLINPVYTQSNNFFSYKLLDATLATQNLFPSTVTWSKVNPLGNDVDIWTNITMANTLDLNGVYGSVQSLQLFNDKIFCFQDKAIGNILYNSRVQIPVTDGVPIEITNGQKVEGNVYITTNYGCDNKWSIAITPSGLYFLDTTSKQLMNLGEGITSVSGTHGFSEWFKNKQDHSSLRSSYDYVNNDLYLNWSDTSLVFSETLGQFTSFMSYEKTSSMLNLDSSTFCFRNDGSNCKMYKMFSGGYCDFFGQLQPYKIKFISNQDSALDKTFLNVESRIDFKDSNGVRTKKFFDYIRVTDEYQDTQNTAINTENVRVTNPYVSGRKKFRIWRTEIPRAFDDVNNRRTLNRIRNTWASVELGAEPPALPTDPTEQQTADYNAAKTLWDNTGMIMHDIEVQYSV